MRYSSINCAANCEHMYLPHVLTRRYLCEKMRRDQILLYLLSLQSICLREGNRESRWKSDRNCLRIWVRPLAYLAPAGMSCTFAPASWLHRRKPMWIDGKPMTTRVFRPMREIITSNNDRIVEQLPSRLIIRTALIFLRFLPKICEIYLWKFIIKLNY